MARRGVDIQITSHDLSRFARALRDEADGAELRRELAANLRGALAPGVVDAKSNILAMHSSGTNTRRPALRQAIAKKIRADVRLTGRWAGARVKARKTPNVRGFRNAPKRTQSARGWRTKSWGNPNAWRVQFGKIHWFDDAFNGRHREYRQAVVDAMDSMARRIASRR